MVLQPLRASGFPPETSDFRLYELLKNDSRFAGTAGASNLRAVGSRSSLRQHSGGDGGGG